MISTSSGSLRRGSSTSRSAPSPGAGEGVADVNPSNHPNASNLSNSFCTICELHTESTFKIEGMDCREEVALIERRFKNLWGLEDFSADLMGQRLHVKYDAAKLTTA